MTNGIIMKDYSEKLKLILNYLPPKTNSVLEINSKNYELLAELSNIFTKSYSYEINNFNLNQNNKFKLFKNDKLKLLDIDKNENNVKSNFFDLIIVNNFFTIIDSEETLNKFILFLKQLLNESGCILFFTKQEKIKTFDKIIPLLENSLSKKNLYFYSNWILPSIKNPLYLGELNNFESLNWFLRNYENFIPSFKQKNLKKKLLLKFLKISNKSLINLLIKIFSPSFLTYCTKSDINNIENLIKIHSNTNSSILMNRKFKSIFILFDNFGNPVKTATITKKNLLKINTFVEGNKIFNNQIKFSDWKSGRILDPLNPDEILLAFNWIVKFQQKHSSNLILNSEILKEIEIMKNIFSQKNFSNFPFLNWIEEYEKFIQNCIIKKTFVHGDLSHKNMILSNSDLIELIDFDFSENLGNPLDDLTTFLFRYLTKSKNKNKLHSFKNNISKSNNTDIFNKIEMVLSYHFNYRVSVDLFLKIYFLRNISTQISKNKNFDELLEYALVLKTK